uniref:DUF834 domain-containing protein n=1 Tax=Oryza sativa subsp. japonica TaxID=39947 RepID=Q6Z4W8_ORYSJ|nr:hypothetical protein [Oryza sativa Japonica Group]BAC99730.1 hypothetical protein [Oryza sativa Japonica Group]
MTDSDGRRPATLDNSGDDQRDGRWPATSSKRRRGTVHGGDGVSATFGDNGRVAGLHFAAANPMDFGLMATTGFPGSSAQGNQLLGLLLTLRSREMWWHRRASAEAAANGGWSGCRRRREKTNAATALQATVERGRGGGRKRRGRGHYL